MLFSENAIQDYFLQSHSYFILSFENRKCLQV